MCVDQFSPFVRYSQLLGCDMTKRFEGTVFRIPLRTPNTAAKSEVQKKPFSVQQIEEMLHEAGRALPELLCFLQFVEEVNIYESKVYCTT